MTEYGELIRKHAPQRVDNRRCRRDRRWADRSIARHFCARGPNTRCVFHDELNTKQQHYLRTFTSEDLWTKSLRLWLRAWECGHGREPLDGHLHAVVTVAAFIAISVKQRSGVCQFVCLPRIFNVNAVMINSVQTRPVYISSFLSYGRYGRPIYICFECVFKSACSNMLSSLLPSIIATNQCSTWTPLDELHRSHTYVDCLH